MRTPLRNQFFLGTSILIVGSSASASSISTTLDKLLGPSPAIPNFTVSGGDKDYTGFTYTPDPNNPIPASAITVTLSDNGPPNSYTLQFTGSIHALPGNSTDLVIGYEVASTSSDLINSAGVFFNGSIGAGSGLATVTDSITYDGVTNVIPAPGAPNPYASLLVYNQGGSNYQLSDSVALVPQSHYSFLKDIQLDAGTGFVQVSVIDQYVSETPEPASFSCLLVGAMGALLARRRARQRA